MSISNSVVAAMLLALHGHGVSGCNKNPDGATSTSSNQTSRYETRGVIKGFTEGRKSVLITHEDIPGFMKAMTMPFEVSSPSVLEGFKEGDPVDFAFTETSGRLVVLTIKKR